MHILVKFTPGSEKQDCWKQTPLFYQYQSINKLVLSMYPKLEPHNKDIDFGSTIDIFDGNTA